jgi:hypothetical protein
MDTQHFNVQKVKSKPTSASLQLLPSFIWPECNPPSMISNEFAELTMTKEMLWSRHKMQRQVFDYPKDLILESKTLETPRQQHLQRTQRQSDKSSLLGTILHHHISLCTPLHQHSCFRYFNHQKAAKRICHVHS